MPKGIGKAAALALARDGADVVVTGFNNMDGVKAVAEEIKAMGRKSLAVRMNGRDYADVQKAFATIKNELGPVNILVNNASQMRHMVTIAKTTVEEWDLVIASNLRSVFLGAQLAYPLLKAAGGGAIVNVSSVHAVATSANIASYAASKGGLLALTRAMAIEFAVANIRVNAILPGAVDTPMLRAGLDRGHLAGSSMQDRLENLARKTVNGRIGKPEEIGRTIYFLADNTQSSLITGQALIVDGGATARLSTE